MLGCTRVVSFGDAINDIPMFEISDECYAVANAVPELKKIATAIIDSNDDDGVAVFLKKISLQARSSCPEASLQQDGFPRQ
jgi:hydroxymethylpyrimidine pyrophosphatase-like HAD family hydrolase